MLRLVGVYGFGKRSVISISSVEVVDLSASVESDPDPAQPCIQEKASLTFLSEDASPEAGLAFPFGDQDFTCNAAGEWVEE